MLLRLCTGVVQDALMDETSREIERLYRMEALKMWRAVVGFTDNREIADDAVAEAFARALQHQGSVRDLRAWTLARGIPDRRRRPTAAGSTR